LQNNLLVTATKCSIIYFISDINFHVKSEHIIAHNTFFFSQLDQVLLGIANLPEDELVTSEQLGRASSQVFLPCFLVAQMPAHSHMFIYTQEDQEEALTPQRSEDHARNCLAIAEVTVPIYNQITA
jgi:hypothetical protein